MPIPNEKVPSENEIKRLAEELVEAYREGEDREISIETDEYSLDEFSLQDFVARYVDGKSIPGYYHIDYYSSEAEYISSRVRMYSEIKNGDESIVVKMDLPFENDEVLEENY